MQSRSCQIILVTEQLGLLNAKVAKEGLEPCDGKLSCPVLRGLGAGNSPRLPGIGSSQLTSFFSYSLDFHFKMSDFFRFATHIQNLPAFGFHNGM